MHQTQFSNLNYSTRVASEMSGGSYDFEGYGFSMLRS